MTRTRIIVLLVVSIVLVLAAVAGSVVSAQDVVFWIKGQIPVVALDPKVGDQWTCKVTEVGAVVEIDGEQYRNVDMMCWPPEDIDPPHLRKSFLPMVLK